MAYSEETYVRKEAGGIDSTVDLPSAEVIQKIAAADKEIDDATGKTEGWDGTEYDYPRVQEISKILAAASCRLRFEPEKAVAQREYGLMLLEQLITEGGEADIVVDKGDFLTFPKNPTARWFGGRYEQTGIPEVTVDPDSIYEQS